MLLPFYKQLTTYMLMIFRNHIDGMVTLGQKLMVTHEPQLPCHVMLYS